MYIISSQTGNKKLPSISFIFILIYNLLSSTSVNIWQSLLFLLKKLVTSLIMLMIMHLLLATLRKTLQALSSLLNYLSFEKLKCFTKIFAKSQSYASGCTFNCFFRILISIKIKFNQNLVQLLRTSFKSVLLDFEDCKSCKISPNDIAHDYTL